VRASTPSRRKRITTLVVTVALSTVFLTSCASTDKPKKKQVTLPGENEVSPLGWGRAYPGDAQTGIGGFPQSR